jgi:predicted transcriptional regulator
LKDALAASDSTLQLLTMPDSSDVRADAKRLIDQLPAGASWDDIAYEVFVRQAIEQGIADADEGRTVDHETALARVRARIRRPA